MARSLLAPTRSSNTPANITEHRSITTRCSRSAHSGSMTPSTLMVSCCILILSRSSLLCTERIHIITILCATSSAPGLLTMSMLRTHYPTARPLKAGHSHPMMSGLLWSRAGPRTCLALQGERLAAQSPWTPTAPIDPRWKQRHPKALQQQLFLNALLPLPVLLLQTLAALRTPTAGNILLLHPPLHPKDASLQTT